MSSSYAIPSWSCLVLLVAWVMDPWMSSCGFPNPPMVAQLEAHEFPNLPSRVQHITSAPRYYHESGTIPSSYFEI